MFVAFKRLFRLVQGLFQTSCFTLSSSFCKFSSRAVVRTIALTRAAVKVNWYMKALTNEFGKPVAPGKFTGYAGLPAFDAFMKVI